MPLQAPARALDHTAKDVTVLGPDEGKAVWFVDHLVVTKVGKDQAAPYAVMEIRLGAGAHTPLHRHAFEAETFYVLGGAMRLYLEGGRCIEARAGSFVHVPPGVAHGFLVPREAKLLVVSSPEGFAELTREYGVPAPRLELPPDVPPDVERLTRLAAKHGIELLGPLPA